VTLVGMIRAGALPACDTLLAEDGMHYLLLDTTNPPRNLPVVVTGVPDTSLVSYCNGGQPPTRAAHQPTVSWGATVQALRNTQRRKRRNRSNVAAALAATSNISSTAASGALCRECATASVPLVRPRASPKTIRP
jgi:hypothetical protein